MLNRTPLSTPTTLPEKAVQDISRALIPLLSDVFALYLKTKNFHWHMSGPHFRDYHLMLDDQGEQLFSMTDSVAERAHPARWAQLRQTSRFHPGAVHRIAFRTLRRRSQSLPRHGNHRRNIGRHRIERTGPRLASE